MSLEINDSSLIACLCEGSAEQAVMDLLLDSGSLIFSRDRLIEERPIRVRNARKFEDRYLRYDFGEPITVLRILDSRHENFILRKAYRHQVSRIYAGLAGIFCLTERITFPSRRSVSSAREILIYRVQSKNFTP